MRWRIAADTGGTFTDCHAVTPEGEVKRCKVLSSGSVRARVVEWSAEAGEVTLEGLPEAADAVWPGWRIGGLKDDVREAILREVRYAA